MKRGDRIDLKIFILSLVLIALTGCAASGTRRSENYHDPNMDFAALRSIAVMPFANLTRDKLAAERVRDTFMISLMSTGIVYVVPAGEVARGISRVGIARPAHPSGEEVAKLAAIVKADAVVTGVVREFGMVRSGAASANVISVSMQMIEKESRKVVWTASSTQGGVSIKDRLIGAGGRPMNEITNVAIDDILNKLFY